MDLDTDPHPLFIDVFRIDVATGERTPLVERTDPAAIFLLDRTGRRPGTWRWTPTAPTRSPRSTPTPTAASCTASAARSTRWACSPSPSPRTAAALLLGTYQDSDDLRLVRLDRETGERSVVAAVDGHSLDTLSAASDTLPPTVFTSRRTGEVIAARFTGDRPPIVPLDPHFAEVHDRAGEALRRRAGLGELRPGQSSAGSPSSSTTATRTRPGSTTTPPATPACWGAASRSWTRRLSHR